MLPFIASITCQDPEGKDKFGTQDSLPQHPVLGTHVSLPPSPHSPIPSHRAIPMRHALLVILGSPEQNNDSVIGSRGHRQRKWSPKVCYRCPRLRGQLSRLSALCHLSLLHNPRLPGPDSGLDTRRPDTYPRKEGGECFTDSRASQTR